MADSTYKNLMRVAITLTVLWVGWSVYDGFIKDATPDSQELAAAFRYLEDGQYQDALDVYQSLLKQNSGNTYALRGKAQALLQLGKFDEALSAYDESIYRQPDMGVTYANRGILKDRMGDYEGALADYRKALALEPEVAEGPGFMTRFLRNQAEKPPTVADRANYLEEQLAKPESQRLLQVPEMDSKQRSYKM
jgi:tetratricopeptide (TPR) repeat protein